MHNHLSVTQMLQSLVAARQQFVSLDEAWVQFLEYLRKRLGADICSTRRLELISAAMNFVAASAPRPRLTT